MPPTAPPTDRDAQIHWLVDRATISDLLVEFVSRGLGRYAGTHHVSANHAITVDGDVARSRSYLIAAHVFDAAHPERHADGAGWYDCTTRRTPDGWQFTSVMLTVTYVSGEPIPH